MDGLIRLVGPHDTVEVLGIKLVGVNAASGKKLLLTLVIVALVYLIWRGLRSAARLVLRGRENVRARFWTHQGITIALAVVLIVGLVSLWFDDPGRLATVLGLVTAGLAFALQKVVTAVAGYLVILRGKTFNVGDRIVMGGVRGDVIALGFIQTTIMEMGQPPPVQSDSPAMWVQARQYTGRIVTISNAKIFDEPVYNYSRDFPYICEEMVLPVPYGADRGRAEHILMKAARKHAVASAQMTDEALRKMRRRYFVHGTEIGPRVYYRLTDNWLEMTVRFVVEDHGIREVKDAMSREIIAALEQAGIGIASSTFEITGLPPLRLDADAVRACDVCAAESVKQ
jgi:small-conductance mechanosensitive channel